MADHRLRQFGWAAIAVLFAAGAVYVLQPEAPEPRRPAPVERRSAPAAEPVPTAPPPPEPARETVPVRPPTPAPPARAEEPPPPLPSDPRERLKALEPLRQEVFAGLADLAGRVEACRLRDSGLVLVLGLETMEARVRVLEVRVEPVGAGTGGPGEPAPVDDRVARCVRGALERTIISAPSARPGRRWEMAWAPGAKP